MLILYTDGGARPNPGVAAFGVLQMRDGVDVRGSGTYLGDNVTNNEAEYRGVIRALEICAENADDETCVFSDSLLVVNQVLGIFEVRKANLVPLHARATKLYRQLPHVKLRHVPRARNAIADRLATRAIDAKGDVVMSISYERRASDNRQATKRKR